MLLPKKERPDASDLRRLYAPPSILKFGDREGERVIHVDADQEQSVFLLHNALNRLDPRVKKFVIAASNTGDLDEAAAEAGLSQAQVAAVLPSLKAFLQQRLR